MNNEINLTAIIIADCIGAILAIVMLGAKIWNVEERKKETRFLKAILYTVVICCVSDILAFTFDGRPGTGAFLAVYAGNFIIYLSNMVLGTLWIALLTDHVFGGVWSGARKAMVWAFDIAGIAVLTVNFFTPVAFSVSPENVYARGSLYWLFVVIQLLFTLDGVAVYSIARRKKANVPYFPVVRFVIPVFSGILVQSMVYGISAIWPAVSIGIFCLVFSLYSKELQEQKARSLEEGRLQAMENQLRHEQLRKEVLDYIINREDDPIELLKYFAERIRVLIDCDQVIYRDLEETRIMVNSPAIENTWAVPMEYCQQCEHFDAHHPMYKDGYTEMENCQEGWRGIPVYHKCPIKSSLTRIVYCDSEVAGYLAFHYVQGYHRFTDVERATIEEFTRILSLSLSRYRARQQSEHAREELITRMSGDAESVYIVNPQTESMTVLAQNRHLSEKYPSAGTYSEFAARYIDTVVFAPDRNQAKEAMNLARIEHRLQDSDEYVFRYRDIAGGNPQWAEIRAMKLSDSEIIYSISYRNEEIITEGLKNSIYDDQFAVFAIDLDSELLTVQKASPLDTAYKVGDCLPYREVLLRLAERLENESDARKLFEQLSDINYVKNDLSNDNKRTYNYQSAFIGKWVTIAAYVASRHEDGTPSMLIMCFSLLDALGTATEELQKQKTIAEQFVKSFIENYDIVYKVSIADNSYSLLKTNEKIAGKERMFESFPQAIEYMLSSIVLEADREKVRREFAPETVREKLRKEKTYSVEFRTLLGDEARWEELTISILDENYYAVGLAVKNEEILLRHLQEKENEDCFALMSVDLDTEQLTVIRKTSRYTMAEVGVSEPYSTVMRQYADQQQGETKEFFDKLCDLSFVREDLAHDDKRSCSYLSMIGEKHKWISLTAYVVARHEDGTPAVFTLGFSYLDTMGADRQEMQEKIKESTEIIAGLASEYLALYYMNIDDGTFRVYSLNGQRIPDTQQLVSRGGNGFELIRRFVGSEAVHPEDRHLFDGLNIESVRERLNHSKRFSVRFRRNYGDGYLWSEMDVVKYEAVNERANVIAIGFAERDKEIRHEQEQQKQLKEALEMAQSANKAKTTFLFNMSHDIRTPMNAILGYTNIALLHTEDSGKVKDSLQKIKLSGGHLLNLINDILEMSRIEAGKLELQNEPFDIREVVTGIEIMSRSLALPRSIDFEVKIGEISNPYVIFDELHFNEIMINIISNAMKFSNEGGMVKYTVDQISGVKDGKAVYHFEVSDRGIGMSEEFLQHIYESFAREKNTTVSRMEGAGLGLSIVKRIVDMAEGTINILSRLGEGTVVFVDLPICVMSDEDIEKFRKEHNTSGDIDYDRVLKGKRLLLVEDNEMNREISEEILSEAGMDVETAEDGDIAVRMVAEKGVSYYDFILMDIQMPVMNGYDATREIRRLPEGNSIPIIAVSANAFAEDRQKSMEAGMNAHIAKPIDVHVLFETMRMLSR